MRPTKTAFYYHNLKNKAKLFLSRPQFILFYWSRFRKYTGLIGFDSFIISYPKSGRTWLQKMIIEAVKAEVYLEIDIDDVSILHDHEPSFPSMLSTHASSSWEEIVHNQDEILKNDIEGYLHAKLIYLYRDPRDVLVSQFHHIRHRSGFTSIRKEDMLLNENVGLRKVINFMNKWKAYADLYPEQIYSLSYEELKKDPGLKLGELLSFIGYDIKPLNIQKAVELTSLNKMKEREKEAKTSSTPWSISGSKKTNAMHSRKGIVGDHKNFFNRFELEMMNDIIAEELDSSYKY